MNYGISILFQGYTLVDGPFVSATEPLCSTKDWIGKICGRSGSIFLRDDLHCLVRHSGNNH